MTLWLTLTALLLVALFLGQRRYYHRQLRKLNGDLDRLLQQGIPLPIDRYREGELSILANQMEKITLRLSENAQRVQREKAYLADSLADISHQLRTPMTAMNLAVTMLRSPELGHQRRMELSAELRTQLTRMNWLVEVLLKMSKLDAGIITLASEMVPVRDLIDQATQPLAIPMDVRDQKLRITCGEECFLGDLSWTAEALGNILKNCMEHTREGGSICISAEETPIFTQLRIEDTGEGFLPEDLPHLFERFYQGKNAGGGSYGIGLALARAVITAQNGTIQAGNGETGAWFLIKFYKQIV